MRGSSYFMILQISAYDGLLRMYKFFYFYEWDPYKESISLEIGSSYTLKTKESIHRRISRHSLGGAETNVTLMTGICLSVFALISILKVLFSHENLPFFALISSQPEF